jgi:hypothetical protein
LAQNRQREIVGVTAGARQQHVPPQPGAFWVPAATSDNALIVTLVPASFMG